jgi:N,N'-diacetylbacillosaminyl-diphospho-undecaprenol alpha-1,3-N-acetylgalactosaminyltransferase
MHIAFIAIEAFSFYHFRKHLVQTLVQRGLTVTVLVPYDAHYTPLIEALGAKAVSIPMERFNAPLKDIRIMWDLWRFFRCTPVDMVHTMTIKPNIYGILAAWIAGVPQRFALVSGAGFMFSETRAITSRIVQKLAAFMYRIALRKSTRVWFQNPDDAEEFIRRGIVHAEQAIVILSSGVDTHKFSAVTMNPQMIAELRSRLGIEPSAHVVLMVAARCIFSKGVAEFIQSAHALAPKYPAWKFLLVAPMDRGTYDAVPENYLREHAHPQLRVITDFQKSIEQYFALADIITLPSYYREGVPRSLIEGMSFGKPVVTTDSVGCRETVAEGVNGFLIPPKNTLALSEALEKLMGDEPLRARMGAASRQRVETIFSQEVVTKQVIENLYRL